MLQNPNAYLLFYRRRTSRPIGGKSHEKVEAARVQPKVHIDSVPHQNAQLPTPPSDGSVSRGEPSVGSVPATILDWPTPSSMVPSSPSSPPPLESLPPPFDEALYDPIVQSSALEGIELSTSQLEFPDTTFRGSPSSVDAEPDLEDNDENPFLNPTFDDDSTQEFSQDSLRLRKAKFSDEDDDEVVDDATDVIMTPSESELDEAENDGSSSR